MKEPEIVKGFPRRIQLNIIEPAERAIYNAMTEVELLGADKRLTRAVTLLVEAKNLVADYIEEKVTPLRFDK